MKLRLMEHIRCPACLSVLRLVRPVIRRVDRASRPELPGCLGQCPFSELVKGSRDCASCIGYEVTDGVLVCGGCGARYAIDEGIPRLVDPGPRTVSRTQIRTASSFGYLWSRSVVTPEVVVPRSYHFDRMEQALSLPSLDGLVLDAGCGEGIDLANQAGRSGVEIVGIELSDGGCRTSVERALPLPAAHIVQADLCRLPFEADKFDFVYSYGVLHHLPSPGEGLQELVRVLKPGARAAAYVYEDFSDRAVGWRWLLAATNQLRRITPRLPHRGLYLLCQAASPVIFALFAVPFRILRLTPGLRSLAAGFPFRHATGPLSLAGDLYDRFSTPVEWRYSRAEVLALF